MPFCKIGPLGYAMAHPRGLMCRTRGVRSINRLLSHNRNCKKNDDLLLRHMKGVMSTVSLQQLLQLNPVLFVRIVSNKLFRRHAKVLAERRSKV